MNLVYLCTLDLAFEGRLDRVRVDGLDGRFFGVGSGTVSGERLSGTVRFTNHPRIRADGATLPELHGAIELADGSTIVIEMNGLSTALGEGGRRDTRASATFIAETEEHRWLNDVFCVCEGAFDMMTGRSTFAVFECVNEIALPTLEGGVQRDDPEVRGGYDERRRVP